MERAPLPVRQIMENAYPEQEEYHMKKLLALLLALLLAAGCALAETAAEATPDADLMDDVDDWLYEDDMEFDEEDEVDDEIFDDLDLEEWDDFDEDADDEEWLWSDSVEDTMLTALEAYSWFVLAPLDIDPEFPDESGTLYRVLDERYNTKEALESYLKTIFSDEIVADLMGMGVYTEIDGFLYTTEDGREMDPNIAENEFVLESEDDQTQVYKVYVFYYEDTEEMEELTYVRKKFGDTWKFTEFPFFW